jgi:hypothetical protein
MSEPTIHYFVTYASDYPGTNGVDHAFFLNAITSIDGVGYANDFIDSHDASNCSVDHAATLQDYPVTDAMKLKVRRSVWSVMKAIEERMI